MPDLSIIRNTRERQFAEAFFDHDEWEYQPGPFKLAIGGKYTPDFKDNRRGCLIEVVGTKQAFSQNRYKYEFFKHDYDIPLEFRLPTGELIPFNKPPSRPIIIRSTCDSMNALERYRTERGLTFEALAALSQVDKGNVNKHCRGLKPIRGESSLRYHVALGIPLPELRPDLFKLLGVEPTVEAAQ